MCPLRPPSIDPVRLQSFFAWEISKAWMHFPKPNAPLLLTIPRQSSSKGSELLSNSVLARVYAAFAFWSSFTGAILTTQQRRTSALPTQGCLGVLTFLCSSARQAHMRLLHTAGVYSARWNNHPCLSDITLQTQHAGNEEPRPRTTQSLERKSCGRLQDH